MSSKAARTRSEPVTLPRLGLAGTLRWIWTQLTSMSTALMLLLLLAVAAVPGSLVPQRRAGPEIVDQWIEDNPVWGPVLDALQFFDVYNSVWFSAIYLLLFVSLVGCVWPRAIQHAKALRQPPARTPRNLTRLPASGVVVLEEGGPSPEEAVARAQAWLRKRRYRVEHRPEAGGASVGAERGYLREIGNILFHVSLIGVLVFMAYGGMTKYGGQKIIVEGEGFANNLVAYDSFTPGTYFSADDLQPFSLTLDSFDAVFDRESETHYGQPLDYTAVMEVREGSEAELQRQILKVNQPLDIDGVRVYLVGNGYAPVVTIRDGAGDVAFQGPVVTRVFDQNYGSQATIKVPDARPDQLGFVGFFLPTAVEDEKGAAFSADPELLNPELQLNSYYGDLGLDTGRPQNVYVLDTASLTELNSRTNENGGIVLSPGQTYELPEGKGSISFDGVRRYVGLDIHYDPGKWGVGVFAGTALLGLAISLFVRRRRVWVRARTDDDGRTRVEYALLARGEEFGLHEEHVALRAAMEKWWPIVAATETADDAAAGAAPSPPPPPPRPPPAPPTPDQETDSVQPHGPRERAAGAVQRPLHAHRRARVRGGVHPVHHRHGHRLGHHPPPRGRPRGPARAGAHRSGPRDRGVAVGGSTAVGASASDAARPTGAAERGVDADGALVDEDMDYTGGGRRPVANVAVAVLAVGWALHAFAVVARGLAASRVPWGNLYEFMTTGALVITTVYLLFLLRKDLRFVGTFVTGIVVAMMCAATMGFPTPVGHLQPPLQTPWLVIHVSIAVLASSLFALTAAMSVLQLLQDRAEKRAAAGERSWAFLRLVPAAQGLENWSYRLNAIAFVMWTFTVIAGAIWAEAAWGRYWNWDTKEVWSFVIWVVYAAYLHARATRGWTGARAAWLSIVGFLCIVFNYTIVNTYFPGLHSYAGLPG